MIEKTGNLLFKNTAEKLKILQTNLIPHRMPCFSNPWWFQGVEKGCIGNKWVKDKNINALNSKSLGNLDNIFEEYKDIFEGSGKF